ncbi:hypothetical protein GCM10011317_53000 [Niveispirillum cyanobacteriorum]|nr:hypothetical protein GCM10011317_53000 [Niveispirillum cyanobacteriorum]
MVPVVENNGLVGNVSRSGGGSRVLIPVSLVGQHRALVALQVEPSQFLPVTFANEAASSWLQIL